MHPVADALAATTDPVSQAIVAVAIVALFAILTIEAAHRVLVVVGVAAALWFVTYLTPFHVIPFESAKHHVDLNVLLLLAGMMALVGVLKDTGVFSWGVAKLMHVTGGRPFVVLSLMVWLTAILSAALDNVTSVIFVMPMVLGMARHFRVRATAFLMPVVMASNVGGTATLIGDPPNILIASGANIEFMAFLLNVAAPVIVMMFITEWMSARAFGDALRTARANDVALPEVPDITNPRLLRWVSVVAVAVFVGFLTQRLTGMPPAVPAIAGAAVAMAIQDYFYLRSHRPTEEDRRHGILSIFAHDIEWPTLAFFAFLFIVVGAAVETGLIERIAVGLSDGITSGSDALGLGDAGTLFFAAVLICWVGGALSAVVDNIPFVAVAIPIVHTLTGALPGDTLVLWWALSLGACLGGNATPVGASANVTVLGIAERSGEHVTFREFAKFGIPVTVVTLIVSTAYLAVYVFVNGRAAFYSFLALGAATFAGRLILRARRGRAA